MKSLYNALIVLCHWHKRIDKSNLSEPDTFDKMNSLLHFLKKISKGYRLYFTKIFTHRNINNIYIIKYIQY